MPPIEDHPLRYELSNELHARPFPTVGAEAEAIWLAIKRPNDAAARDREADRQHLLALLDRHGAQHPQPGATHYSGKIGRHDLKWESHTEFVTYTILSAGLGERPFDPAIWAALPEDWLAAAPGQRITSAQVRILKRPGNDATITQALRDWFEPESLAASAVLDDSAVIASDFRIDAGGHMRFAIFAGAGTGPARIGRILQRLCEVETYKAMAMLGLPRARDLNAAMARIDGGLSALLDEMSQETAAPEAALEQLLTLATDLETLMSRAAFRFGATGAYEAIVNQRVQVLRENRFNGHQTFAEFMMRRFDPAMRTVKSTERQLRSMTDRAQRASDLLRTKVEVGRSAQNQEVLASMDRRAALQLRLQETVEGLSVVAISYYGVNLLAYLLAPLAYRAGIEKPTLTALLVLPVIAAVWLLTRRIRKAMH
ncbi:DUF3422 family protein [Alterinioella nitratireducens]|uniref:DUF3422 family protein n=1 Tax=Alterinioella nitratireducens TaxID=2735915 RepID=UPI004059E6C6